MKLIAAVSLIVVLSLLCSSIAKAHGKTTLPKHVILPKELSLSLQETRAALELYENAGQACLNAINYNPALAQPGNKISEQERLFMQAVSCAPDFLNLAKMTYSFRRSFLSSTSSSLPLDAEQTEFLDKTLKDFDERSNKAGMLVEKAKGLLAERKRNFLE